MFVNSTTTESNERDHMQSYASLAMAAYYTTHEVRRLLPQKVDLSFLTYLPKDSTDEWAVYQNTGRNPTFPEYIVSFRGTDYQRPNDYIADSFLFLGLLDISPRYYQCVSLVKSLQERSNNPSNIVLTGHSLGGALAYEVGRETKIPTIGFNRGAGMGENPNVKKFFQLIFQAYTGADNPLYNLDSEAIYDFIFGDKQDEGKNAHGTVMYTTNGGTWRGGGTQIDPLSFLGYWYQPADANVKVVPMRDDIRLAHRLRNFLSKESDEVFEKLDELEKKLKEFDPDDWLKMLTDLTTDIIPIRKIIDELKRLTKIYQEENNTNNTENRTVFANNTNQQNNTDNTWLTWLQQYWGVGKKYEQEEEEEEEEHGAVNNTTMPTKTQRFATKQEVYEIEQRFKTTDFDGFYQFPTLNDHPADNNFEYDVLAHVYPGYKFRNTDVQRFIKAARQRRERGRYSYVKDKKDYLAIEADKEKPPPVEPPKLGKRKKLGKPVSDKRVDRVLKLAKQRLAKYPDEGEYTQQLKDQIQWMKDLQFAGIYAKDEDDPYERRLAFDELEQLLLHDAPTEEVTQSNIDYEREPDPARPQLPPGVPEQTWVKDDQGRTVEGKETLAASYAATQVGRDKEYGDYTLNNQFKPHSGAPTLRPQWGSAGVKDVIPSGKEQLRSDLEFDMFSVVQPGYGEGRDNKLFNVQEARTHNILPLGKQFKPCAWLGPLNYQYPLPWQWQNVKDMENVKAYIDYVMAEKTNAMMTAIKFGEGSSAGFGRDVPEEPLRVSSSGLPRDIRSPFEPAIHNSDPMTPTHDPAGYLLQKRGLKRTYSAFREPQKREEYRDNNGPILNKRRSLEVILP